MYPVSPGWRWRPISRTRRGVAHLCTFPPSGEVLLPNCPPPGGGLDIRWWKSCLFECALPGGTVRRPFYRGGGCPCVAIYRGRYPAKAIYLGRYPARAVGTRLRPFTAGGTRLRPFTGGGTRLRPFTEGGTRLRPCHQSTSQDRTQLLSACLPPEHRTGTPVAPPSAGPHVGGLATSPEGEHYCGGG